MRNLNELEVMFYRKQKPLRSVHELLFPYESVDIVECGHAE